MANPKRSKESYYTEEYKLKQSLKLDRNFGPILEHKKVCKRCKSEYTFVGREKTKAFENSRFCSRSCANHRGTGLEWEETHKSRSLTHYRTICFSEWEQNCAICRFDKIVSVHHIDENHDNNDIKNLIPLCPNHHHMIHSKEWGAETKDLIEEITQKKWACNSVG